MKNAKVRHSSSWITEQIFAANTFHKAMLRFKKIYSRSAVFLFFWSPPPPIITEPMSIKNYSWLVHHLYKDNLYKKISLVIYWLCNTRYSLSCVLKH